MLSELILALSNPNTLLKTINGEIYLDLAASTSTK